MNRSEDGTNTSKLPFLPFFLAFLVCRSRQLDQALLLNHPATNNSIVNLNHHTTTMKTQELLSSVLTLCAISAVSVSANPVEKRLPSAPKSKHLRPHYLSRRDEPGYAEGNPIDGKGKGAPLLGK
jgi:hypothetical protein